MFDKKCATDMKKKTEMNKPLLYKGKRIENVKYFLHMLPKWHK